MTGPEVLDVARDAIYTLVIVSAPVMLVGLVVGVAISLLQALTQIQEMTLAFVPKILAIFVSLLVALPFMAERLNAEMLRLAARIGDGWAAESLSERTRLNGRQGVRYVLQDGMTVLDPETLRETPADGHGRHRAARVVLRAAREVRGFRCSLVAAAVQGLETHARRRAAGRR